LLPPPRTGPGQPATATPTAEVPPSVEDPEMKRPAYRARRRLIADEIEDRLRDAGLLDHWQAATVLDMADALDWSRGSLSSRATAHRELERQMSNLLRGQDEPGSAVGGYRDELQARRARRTGAAS
jgi:hypothetical protein